MRLKWVFKFNFLSFQTGLGLAQTGVELPSLIQHSSFVGGDKTLDDLEYPDVLDDLD